MEKTAEIKKFTPPKQKIEDDAVDYLKSRGLSDEVIASGRVVSGTKWLRKANCGGAGCWLSIRRSKDR